MRKGVILAGGSGTRLYPATIPVSKQLIPVYDKPMIYYPLCILMLAGIREILVITTPRDQESFVKLLGDGRQWGLSVSYAEQPRPEGLAQAFVIGEDFIGNDPVALVLGDNVFWGHGLLNCLKTAVAQPDGAMIFAYRVHDPHRYGVVEFDSSGKALSIEEKPVHPRSSFAVTGLYFFESSVCAYARQLEPSKRGELEMSDLIRIYLKQNRLRVVNLGRGIAWLDTGTHESMQGMKVCCPEEIAYRLKYINSEQLKKLVKHMGKNGYGAYLLDLIDQ